jgi:hypothetical protein
VKVTERSSETGGQRPDHWTSPELGPRIAAVVELVAALGRAANAALKAPTSGRPS